MPSLAQQPPALHGVIVRGPRIGARVGAIGGARWAIVPAGIGAGTAIGATTIGGWISRPGGSGGSARLARQRRAVSRRAASSAADGARAPVESEQAATSASDSRARNDAIAAPHSGACSGSPAVPTAPYVAAAPALATRVHVSASVTSLRWLSRQGVIEGRQEAALLVAEMGRTLSSDRDATPKITLHLERDDA